MCNVLVSGANGFVGRALCDLLISHEMNVSAAVRGNAARKKGLNSVSVGDIGADTDWCSVLEGVDCVVHLAARVHVMNETNADPLEAFRRVNTAGSEKLARDAAKMGVKRLIYLSTIKVNGEQTYDVPFNEKIEYPPIDPYGVSKWEAEKCLRQVSAETGMEVVIIRPPLIYGPGVKGNFLTMLKLVSKGFPLPLACAKNKRSFIGLSNLVDLIRECIVNPRARGQTFLVSDGEDVSTAELIKVIAASMGKSSPLVPVPVSLLNLGAAIVGKKAVARRLLGSLQVDSSHVRQVLGWLPSDSVEHEVERVVAWYQAKEVGKYSKI